MINGRCILIYIIRLLQYSIQSYNFLSYLRVFVRYIRGNMSLGIECWFSGWFRRWFPWIGIPLSCQIKKTPVKIVKLCRMINSMEPLSWKTLIKKKWICRLLNLYPADNLDFVIDIYIYIHFVFWRYLIIFT